MLAYRPHETLLETNFEADYQTLISGSGRKKTPNKSHTIGLTAGLFADPMIGYNLCRKTSAFPN